MAHTVGTLTVTPITPGFGAEVTGADFSQPISPEVLKDMLAIQQQYGVTVYRNTGLDNAGHAAFSRLLGTPELAYKSFFEEKEIFDASNIARDAGGKLVQATDSRYAFGKGNALWHSDGSYKPYKIKYALLLAHEVPADGGDTEFANVRKAFKDLPEQKKKAMSYLTVEHDFWHSRKTGSPEAFAKLTQAQIDAFKPVFHPLVQTTSTGEQTMVIGGHAKTIEGFHGALGPEYLAELLKHATQPEYTFSLKWNGPGDLVWYDNQCVLHRSPPALSTTERRDLRRTTVLDKGEDQYASVRGEKVDEQAQDGFFPTGLIGA